MTSDLAKELRRERIATSTLSGLLATIPNDARAEDLDRMLGNAVMLSVTLADALIAELDKRKAPFDGEAVHRAFDADHAKYYGAP